MIILITGYKRSGKDTVASYLSYKYGFTQYAFAKPIKEISYKLFDWDPKDDEILKETIDEKYGFSRRQFWQYFGTEWAQYQLPAQFKEFNNKIGKNLWVEKFKNLYLKNPNISYVISDYRFFHEYELLKQFNPFCIKVTRPSLQKNDLHESEQYIDNLYFDKEIINDGTITDLYQKVDAIIAEIIQ